MYFLITALLLIGLCVSQILIGGVNLLFSIPAYLAIALAAVIPIAISSRKQGTGARFLPVVFGLVLAAYVLIRSRLSAVDYLAWTDFFMVLAAFAVYLLTAFYLTRPRQRLLVLYVLFAMALAHTVGGILQFTRDDNFMLLSLLPDGSPVPKFFRPDYGWRASGFYICPNHLAGLLETLGLLALGACCLGDFKVKHRVILGYVTLSCMVGVSLTGSRGGYISTIGGVVALLLLFLWVIKKLRPGRFSSAFLVATSLSVVLIGGAIWGMSQSTVLENRMGQVVDTGNMRLLMWQAALKQYALNPAFGTGSGSYLYYGRHFRDASVQNDPVHVHNDYLELLCEYGFVGAGLFAIFLILHIHSGWRAISSIVNRRLLLTGHTTNDELALLVGALAALAALVIHSVVDFNFHIPSNTLFFAFLFGILANPTSDSELTTSEPTLQMRLARFALPMIGVALALLAFPLLRGEYSAEWARINLRNLIYVDSIANTNTAVAFSAPSVGIGQPLPASGGESSWAADYRRQHMLANAISLAERGIEQESKNPNLYYYLGEAQHFSAVFEEAPEKKRIAHEAAATAYAQGLALFPNDARLQLKLARAYDDLGLFDKAGEVFMEAMRFDPNFGNTYAGFGYHLWLQRKINRAEAYYRKALELDPSNDLAGEGMKDVQHIRALARNVEYVELNGDPLESMDTETVTPADEQLGVHDVVANE